MSPPSASPVAAPVAGPVPHASGRLVRRAHLVDEEHPWLRDTLVAVLVRRCKDRPRRIGRANSYPSVTGCSLRYVILWKVAGMGIPTAKELEPFPAMAVPS
jgi:hypothetical protein